MKHCGSMHNRNSKESLNLITLKGVFFLLCFGLGISIAVFLLELVLAAGNDDADESHRTFYQKFRRRCSLKLDDIKTEWVNVPRTDGSIRLDNDGSMSEEGDTVSGPRNGNIHILSNGKPSCLVRTK